jgi:mRNA-degrading endonuclease toxin of MazEF toxin-antitoxin module
VVQSDHRLLSAILVAPASTSANAASFRPRIALDGTISVVLTDQVTAVDGETRIGDFAGSLGDQELAEVDRALRLVFALR